MRRVRAYASRVEAVTRPSTWGATGSLTRDAERQRREALKRQREAEREIGRVPRGRLGTRDDEHAEVADQEPPGWARSDR